MTLMITVIAGRLSAQFHTDSVSEAIVCLFDETPSLRKEQQCLLKAFSGLILFPYPRAIQNPAPHPSSLDHRARPRISDSTEVINEMKC